MTFRQKPKIFMEREIKNPKRYWEVIGRIFLVKYTTGKHSIPHIEFKLDEDWRGKGIMSKELGKYLKWCKSYQHMRLIAVVKKDNLPSIKVLEKHDFVRVSEIEDNFSYMLHMDFTKKQLETILKNMLNYFGKDFNGKDVEV